MKNALLATVALTALAMPAMAIETIGDKVKNDENYKPLGVKAGSFLVVPRVDVEETFDDNIYATTNNTESDMITTVRPSVSVRSDWNRHALNALVNVERNEYLDNDDESTTNTFAGVDGKVDVMRGTAIGGGVSFERSHEDRGNPNSVATATEPTELDTLTARAGVYRELGRVNARFDSEAKNVDYKNGTTTAGGFINNDLRDRNEYTQTLRVGYEAKPGTEVFVRGSLDNRVYDRKGGTTPLRSSSGQEIVVGTAFDITGKTAGELYAGTIDRNYSNGALKDVSDVTYGGKVTWNATDLTTVTGSIDRSVEETIIGASSSYLATAYRAGVEHALRRNLLIGANAGFTTNEYEGNAAAQRDDEVLSAGVGATYLINRNLKASAGYTLTERDSNAVGSDYDRNRLMLRLSAAF